MTVPYLSKIDLNPLRRGTQKFLSNPQALHAAVLGGVPATGTSERMLWREERQPHVVSLLVLSQSEPSWEHIIEQAGWGSAQGEPLIRDLSPLLSRVGEGDTFHFRVRANPVKSVAHPDGVPARERGATERTRGKRVAPRNVEEQLRWFVERAGGDGQRWGFSVLGERGPSVRIVGRETARFSKGKNSHRVTLSRVTFEGRLKVTSVEVFRQSIINGIGPGKAYGCGLLTLAR